MLSVVACRRLRADGSTAVNVTRQPSCCDWAIHRMVNGQDAGISASVVAHCDRMNIRDSAKTHETKSDGTDFFKK